MDEKRVVDEKLESPQTSGEVEEGETVNKVCTCSCGIDGHELKKQLTKLRRQNFITHCLLSLGILITVGWQISIVSLLYRVKDGVSHPFKSLGGIIGGLLFKGPANNIKIKDGERHSPIILEHPIIQPSTLPGLKIPHMELPAEILAEIKSYSVTHARKRNLVSDREN